jgi:DNA (cytosine-5)-methyltransferase 1
VQEAALRERHRTPPGDGFPDTFRLERGTRRDRIKLLGNAVCPPVMQAIVAGLVADHASTAPAAAAA